MLINVSSIGGIMTVPAYTVYNSSKFAVEGLSEGLWYELGTFGIKVKVIEPGAIKTDFGGRSLDVWDVSSCPTMRRFMDKVSAARAQLHPELERARTGRRGIYQSGERSKRPHALSRRRRRESLRSPLRRLLGAGVTMKLIKRRFGL